MVDGVVGERVLEDGTLNTSSASQVHISKRNGKEKERHIVTLVRPPSTKLNIYLKICVHEQST